jgi:Fic family protein
MNYLTVKQIATKWKISERQVRTLCSSGRIPGAYKMGWIWSVPDSVEKPADIRRTKDKNQHQSEVLFAPVQFKGIETKKLLLDQNRPLPQNTLQSLHENIIVEWTYNSNAIEGNTLTISETRVVLEGITIGGKSIREHLEVMNHKDAILYLEELVKNEEQLSEWTIKNLHCLILKKIDDNNAGKYRGENVLISGARHRPPEHFLVKENMERLVESYSGAWQKLHPVERASLLHGEFVKIHPFIDGNGRTARLLMNFELMKSGYPPTIIKAEMRPTYYDALDSAHTTGDYTAFIALVSGCVETSLDLWLSLL